MATWYMVTKRFGIRVERVEVERETTSTLALVNGKRVLKNTAYEAYFATFNEAKMFAVKRAELLVDNAQRELSFTQANLDDVMRLKEID